MNFPQQVTTRSDDLSSREILRSIPSLADELADVEEELDTLEALVPAEIENFSSQSAEKETWELRAARRHLGNKAEATPPLRWRCPSARDGFWQVLAPQKPTKSRT